MVNQTKATKKNIITKDIKFGLVYSMLSLDVAFSGSYWSIHYHYHNQIDWLLPSISVHKTTLSSQYTCFQKNVTIYNTAWMLNACMSI